MAIQNELPSLGPSGVRGNLIFDSVSMSNRTIKSKLENSLPRKFILKGLFCKTTKGGDIVQGSVSPREGSSFFSVALNIPLVELNMDGDSIVFHINDSCELSCAVFECTATSHFEAREIFHKKVMVFIDYLCYANDLPLNLTLLESRDESGDCSVINYESPYFNKNLDVNLLSSRKELEEVYSLYREAKNSDSPYYRFLCYYKILEGIYGHLEIKLFMKAKKEGISLQRLPEVIPENENFPSEYIAYNGWKVRRFFKDILEHKYRDVCAHFVLDGASVLRLSDYAQYVKFTDIIYITEICCRLEIKNLENCFEQLDKIKSTKI